MYNKKIDAIEDKIRKSTASEAEKIRMLALAEELRSELGNVDENKALELAALAEDNMFPTLKNEAAKFDITHPRLSGLINEFSNLLASIGI